MPWPISITITITITIAIAITITITIMCTSEVNVFRVEFSWDFSWDKGEQKRVEWERYSVVHKGGGLAKGGLAIYEFPLCDCNTLGSVFHVQIEHTPNC